MSHTNVTKEMSGVDKNSEGKPYHRKRLFLFIIKLVLT
jgi:hypothetical protein